MTSALSCGDKHAGGLPYEKAYSRSPWTDSSVEILTPQLYSAHTHLLLYRLHTY